MHVVFTYKMKEEHLKQILQVKLQIGILSFCALFLSWVQGLDVKTCYNFGTFKQILDVSLSMCAKECFRRQRCQMVMYHNGMNYCALKDLIDVASLDTKSPVCEYYPRDDWSHLDLGACQGHTCDVTERCKSKTDGGFECQKTECPKSDDISDAKRLSTTHTIGTTNRYKCDNGFVGHGNPTITCGDDATWSVTDFRCVHAQSCPTPLVHYNNADLTHIEGGLYTPGTELTFTCKENYRGTRDEWKITCLDTLLWDSDKVQCCLNSTTHERQGRCYRLFEGGVVTSLNGAYDVCDDIGGFLEWAYWDIVPWFDTSKTEYVLMYLTLADVNDNWDYMNCAAVNNVIGDPTKSLREKVEEVTANNWQGPNCWWGNQWLPGYPDGSNGDECIVRSTSDPNSKFLSFPCEFVGHNDVGFACSFDDTFITQTP